ncbi:MAG: peptide chain release factor N(5)-glutamine methyltransferase [Lachnospiraceae bacterium]
MSTYKEVYGRAIAQLTEYEVPDAAVDAWYLFEYVTGLHRAEYFLIGEDRIPKEQEEQFFALIKKRCERIPLQYLTGVQEFMGFPFAVSPATLIPRQDTERLVEEAMKYADGKRVLDLCTGTGCIIISLAKLCKLTCAVGTDISEEALETAKKNAEELNAAAEFYCGDLFAALPDDASFDMIVSNPPYIRTEEIPKLMPEVREYEPMTALDGDTDGLKFYRAIISEAPKYLSEGGRLLFEIGCEQAAAVSALMEQRGFTKMKVGKDYASLDRIVSGMWRG